MSDKEAKKNAALQFAGQDSADAKAAVKAQREVKKKKDALRKVEKKLKAMKPEDAGYSEAKAEETQILAEIAALEGVQVAAASAVKTAASQPAAATAAAASSGKAPQERVVEAAEDLEANALRLRQLVERAMKMNRSSAQTAVTPRASVVHPSVAEVALMTEEMVVVGGNARTLAMINAFRDMIKSTTVLAGSNLVDVDTAAFEQLVAANFAFLRRKREASSGMSYVKEALVRRLVALRDDVMRSVEAKQKTIDTLCDPREIALHLLDLIEGELCMSLKSIVEDRSLPYVSSSDTILVFGRSSIVEFILLSRASDPQRKPKRVIVLDSAPLYEGRMLAQRLSAVGIDVTYGLLTACCTLIPQCTRVFIGAASVLQNGDVFGRGGTALVAACAKCFRKPVLCFAESYKFVSEVWLGNLAQNTKLGDIRDHPGEASTTRSPLAYSTPNIMVSPSQQQPHLQCDVWSKGRTSVEAAADRLHPAATLNPNASGYLYDLTPSTYVDMVICEMGCLHTSAIIAAIKDREGRDASPLIDLNKR